MIIKCPKCGFTGEIDAAKIPEKGARLTCKQCQEKFPISRPAAPEAAAPSPATPLSQPPVPQAATQQSDAPQPAPAAAEQAQTQPVQDKTPQFTCSMCGGSFGRPKLARFGEKLVCANCKPAYVQMLQQGVAQTANMRYAGFWIRFGAKFIDGILIMILLMPLSMLVTSDINVDPSNPAAMSSAMTGVGLMYLIQIIIPAAMTCFFLGRFQATPGKMALGLIVVTPERGRISYLRALGRHFAEWISSLILAIGYIMVAFSDEKCALHDRICSTRVVYKK
jgi:uncharacterized RDD family membrane protein YckC/uncharacterized protein YbaR (Trm112 family)